MRPSPLDPRTATTSATSRAPATTLLAAAMTTLMALALMAAAPARAQQAAAGSPATRPAPAAPSAATCPPLLQHTMKRLQDEAPQPLCQYAGRVLLVVNTASQFG